MATTPHFSLPFRFVVDVTGKSSAAVNEQDSYEDIKDCVSAIVRYARGERPEAPAFGITPQEFAMPVVDTNQILEQVTDSEPRVQMLVESSLDSVDQMITNVIISISDPAQSTKPSQIGGSDV